MLCTQRIDFSYGHVPIFRGLSVSFPPGAYTAVIGPNGSGKSTLLHLLCGARAPDGGAIRFGGTDIQTMSIQDRARAFAVIHQQESARLPFRCVDVVLMGRYPHRNRFARTSTDDLRAAQAWMERTQIDHLMLRPFDELSGGEKQRVLITRALMQQPKLLFLDESMNELDIHARMQMIELIRGTILASGGMVVAVHHDLSLAWRYADRVVALNKGAVVATGTPTEVMDESFFADVFHVQAEIFPGRGFFLRNSL